MNELALQSNPSEGLRELALFAGAGGGILGGKLLGWRTVCAVEINDYCQRVLMQRQCDGILEPFPIWDDVRTFDGRPWRGIVDVVSGGFPCKGVSAAGPGDGMDNPETGLWRHMARIIYQAAPRFVLVENGPLLVSRGLDCVLRDLAGLGYNAKWGVLGGHHAGATQTRNRLWLVAYAHGERCRTEAKEPLLPGRAASQLCTWWSVEPGLDRVAYGIPDQMERGRALGNAQIPAVVRLAWETLAR